MMELNKRFPEILSAYVRDMDCLIPNNVCNELTKFVSGIELERDALRSTITQQEDVIKRLKEDGERLAKRWVEYHNDETISCQYCGLTQSGFKNKHTPGCPITKHTALMSELEKRE